MKQSPVSERPAVPHAFFVGVWNGVLLSLPLWGMIVVCVVLL